jgi:hypothetical protein
MMRLSAALLVCAVVLLVFGVYRAVTAAQSQPVVQCFFPSEKDRVIELSHQAVDEAFKEQVKSLFGVWVRDPAEQPKRAMSGMATNISAYHRARANVRQWDPVICQ